LPIKDKLQGKKRLAREEETADRYALAMYV